MNKTTNKLKEKYIEIVNDFKQSLDTSKCLELPRLLAPYQFHYHDLLKEYSSVNDKVDELYYEELFNYKIQNSEMSHVDLSSTELKKMIECSTKYRNLIQQQKEISNDMKLIEDMIRTIRDFNFSMSNTIKYKELMGK